MRTIDDVEKMKDMLEAELEEARVALMLSKKIKRGNNKKSKKIRK